MRDLNTEWTIKEYKRNEKIFCKREQFVAAPEYKVKS